jgi:hypothetical protein
MRLKKLRAGLWSYKLKHHRYILILLSVLLLFNSCASSRLVYPENTIIPEDFAGIVHAGGSRTQREFAYMDYLGASWILHTFNWDIIEPEQGDWDFLFFDDLVDRNKAAGIKIIGVLAYDVWWIHDDMEGHRYVPPQGLPAFLNYVRKTVEHFRGRVDAWCIWNEPNFPYFWNGTDDEFIELHRQAADAIREIDNEVILLGGAFNRNVTGLPEKFIRGIFESGAMDKIDGIAFHPYELNPYRTALLYEKFRIIVDEYGFGDKIWITEVGYPTGGWYPTRIQEKRLPEYVIKTWVLLAAGGAQKILWYQLFDPFLRSNGNSEDFFGLVRSRRDYASKGAEAFRLCAIFLSETSCYAIEPGTDGLPRSIHAFWFRGTGRGVLVLWNDNPGQVRVRLQFSGTNYALHDPVTGAESQIQADTAVRVGRTPVFIKWDGNEDRPVIRLF